MYIPDLYKNENQEEIKKFLQENSFGLLVNQTDGKLWATHIPLELDKNEAGKDVLLGHLSKENPQWKSFTSEKEVLTIFSGPNCYISPSWYDHENVPTWNYAAVHIYGTIKIIEGEALLLSLKKLIDKYESNSENPIRMEDLSEETMRQTQGIVAFEIEINTIQAVKKMSQNRDEKNFQNIICQLEKTKNPNELEVAKTMSQCPRQNS
jgi:transcriptional regulator